MEFNPCQTSEDVKVMVLAGLNVIQTAFTAWLVHRRYLADKREFRRNGHEREDKSGSS